MKHTKNLPTRKKSGDLRFTQKKNFRQRSFYTNNGNNSSSHVKEPKKTDISAIIDPSKHSPIYSGIRLPELLAPAGSPDSLRAAINAGADAIYFGGGEHNARINAHNFTNEELEYSIKLLHDHGRKAYITLNTLLCDREITDYLHFAEFLYRAGADALIVADLGGACAIHRIIPEFELHASTQMSGHNTESAGFLQKLGFSRMVCAREMPKEDIAEFVKDSPIEAEVFVHGALCVCHSGQCLFSSLVGGRSGNRGECAQPCRLPYGQTPNNMKYPLSLKDLSLANHLSFLVKAGVSSLKIEGRMKSPEYVYGVTKAFRTLLDCASDATHTELESLAGVFSRGGFTDGYFEKNIGSSMLGVRSDSDKQSSKRITASAPADVTAINNVKIPVTVRAEIKKGKPALLEISTGQDSVCVLGDIPDQAINAPLTFENIKKNLTKFGDTDFLPERFDLDLDEGIMLPVSSLNALRRDGTKKLSDLVAEKEAKKTILRSEKILKYSPLVPEGRQVEKKSARFYSSEQIPENAYDFFDTIYLPLDKFNGECKGVVLPAVIFDSERRKVEKMLGEAKKNGAKYALVGNIGALGLAVKYELVPNADFRLNACNNESVAELEKCGFGEIILSPELTLPKIRDIKGNTVSIVYGRIPLMLLEKCVIRETSDCETCKASKAEIVDRYGVHFPVLREWEHRNIIYNSLPTYMADKGDDLEKAHVLNRHFIFSSETKEECEKIISAYQRGLPFPFGGKVRRIR